MLDWTKFRTFSNDLWYNNNFRWWKGRKHCGKKKKELVTSIFSFSYNVFKSLLGSWKTMDCLVKIFFPIEKKIANCRIKITQMSNFSCWEGVESKVGKGDNDVLPDVSPFSKIVKLFFLWVVTLKTWVYLEKSSTGLQPATLHPFPNNPLFLYVCTKCFLKTLWEKEKLLETSNFSFSNSVFYPLGKLSAIFHHT